MVNVKEIIECLDHYLEITHQSQISAVNAAEILDRKGLLKDSPTRKGKPLRDLLRAGKIPNASQSDGVHWHIFHSDNFSCKKTQPRRTHEISTVTASTEILMDVKNVRNVCDLCEDDIPASPGLYMITIRNIENLPPYFSEVLKKRNHSILYIGQASKSLRQRLWKQELHAIGHGTFFRSVGAILGFLPPRGSLITHANKRNYTFSPADEASIISWMNENLAVNTVICSDNLDNREEELIRQYLPLINLDKNPERLERLEQLRKRCVEIANEK